MYGLPLSFQYPITALLSVSPIANLKPVFDPTAIFFFNSNGLSLVGSNDSFILLSSTFKFFLNTAASVTFIVPATSKLPFKFVLPFTPNFPPTLTSFVTLNPYAVNNLFTVNVSSINVGRYNPIKSLNILKASICAPLLVHPHIPNFKYGLLLSYL